MKQLYILICAGLLLAACTTTKHTINSTVTVHDTLQVHDTLTREHDRIVNNTVYKHDTTIVIPGSDIKSSYTAAQLQPATQGGHKVPLHYNLTKNNLHQDVDIDTAGTVTIDCKADSMQAVIANLTEINHDLTDSLAHLVRSTTDKTNDASSSIADSTIKIKTWWGRWWKWILIIGGLAAACEGWHIYRNWGKVV